MQYDNSHFSIKTWNKSDRPREKLIAKGKNALSDAELLAILVGSGSRDESAVALCLRILASVDNQIHKLGKLSIKQLMQFKGIGEAKAITIIAGLELGKRRKNEAAPKIQKITSSKDVFELMQSDIGDLDHEEFWVLFLNNSHVVMQKKQISSGGQTATLVDVRIIFRAALDFGATHLVLTHNHPSGNLTPSTSDRKLTNKIKEAGIYLDIQILDHVIIYENKYFSFADANLL